ncbi:MULTISPECIES: TetR/AcrR family transcriptional regulator [Clostridium]|uniref:Fatty acid metabolism regulator protein n=3 Tax=Clostridium TaxID=1485 RepID=D8GPB6_CLOLD|nr:MULTISPECIES: TetR/AcrR family transcriptional regulator [Clostridium]ADK15994.1 predicted transcriptional regulator [Clostridium ljungdahlii DSM 13528]OAA87131.1 Fatty acid metabolism regulator protein [Clostridium ljungdahlii DSM 13528]OAA93781.1 Fatty acid metabolism regulator protein [Clostridium coskatii]OBR96071.1 fatty acid metabolism regulator protein [Clostridium coskatii]
MINERKIREPQQKRSIEKKDKILKAGYKLICKNGYYKTTTSEIATEAGVSIGCLYSYFKDKHTIFLDILKKYQAQFDKLRDEFMNKMLLFKSPEECFREFMLILIDIHDKSVDFQREVRTLYYYDPEVAALSDDQRQKIQDAALYSIKLYKEYIDIDDYEAAAIVTSLIINSVVDDVSLYKSSIDRNRILDETVKALCRYLKMKPINHLNKY